MRRSGNGGVEVSRFGRNYPDPLGRDRHAGAHRRVGDEDEQPSVIYPGGYQGKFSQVALFCNAKNVGEVTSCGVEFEDSSTPDVLNKFPNVYLLRPNNAGTNVTYDVYRMFIG